MTRIAAVRGCDAATHRPHALHAGERIWPQKNCYVDLWIELLHALGLDPCAMLPFVFAIDFEGDQWTFFKPPLSDLRTLYGIDVQELNVWRPLQEHALEHIGAGKLLSIEVDAWWLPDTAGTDYREDHSKTTIVANEIDLATGCLGYFHNAGYFSLDGEDFAGIFANGGGLGTLPLYAELIRIDRVVVHQPETLRTLSRRLLAEHLAWRPECDPIERFRDRFMADLPRLQTSGLQTYHKWAFAGLRQLGAAAELAAAYLRWLWGDAALEQDAQAFDRVAKLAKALTLKAARAVSTGKALDPSEAFAEMSEAWQTAMRAVIEAQSCSHNVEMIGAR